MVALVAFSTFLQGLEMLPNREQWSSFGGLVKDGALFTAAKARVLVGKEQ